MQSACSQYVSVGGTRSDSIRRIGSGLSLPTIYSRRHRRDCYCGSKLIQHSTLSSSTAEASCRPHSHGHGSNRGLCYDLNAALNSSREGRTKHRYHAGPLACTAEITTGMSTRPCGLCWPTRTHHHFVARMCDSGRCAVHTPGCSVPEAEHAPVTGVAASMRLCESRSASPRPV